MLDRRAFLGSMAALPSGVLPSVSDDGTSLSVDLGMDEFKALGTLIRVWRGQLESGRLVKQHPAGTKVGRRVWLPGDKSWVELIQIVGEDKVTFTIHGE